jgi:hypothetical protein
LGNGHELNFLPGLKALVGVINLGEEDLTEAYVDYLEEKYG